MKSAMYTTIQKFEGQYDFQVFLKVISYAYQDCIYLIKNTVKTKILLQFK